MTKDTDWPFISTVLILGFFVALIVYAVRASDEFDARCRARGGEPVHMYKSSPLCLRPGSVIDTEAP